MRISIAVGARMNQQSSVKLVLFVEDESASRRGYVMYLTAAGFNVQEAATGQAALSAARARRPDVIVLDLGLPDIDGWEVARQLRAAPALECRPARRNPPAMVALFDAIGVGQWFRHVTGAIEIVSAVALLTPSFAPFGALLLASTMVLVDGSWRLL